MAYDGYYSNPYQTGPMNPPNDGYSPTPPYPTQYDERINMPQPQMPTNSPAPNPELYPEPRYPQNQSQDHNPGAINDAVNSAVHSSGSTGYLSPEVLSQITATVIQQLKSTGLDNIQGSPSAPGPPPPRSQSQQPAWQTDPSVRPHAESPPAMAARSNSIPPSVPVSGGSTEPFKPYVEPYVEPEYGDTRPNPRQTPDPSFERRGSMSSQGSARSHHKEARPKPPDRDATVMEMTTLERIWGKLFEEGKPTRRLGQFLRGIALHLIEDYPPGNTIVIVPHKLQKFYKDTQVSSDSYPWHDIFDDRTSSISRLFRDVEAEHHLVQDKLSERPDIPGLTPKGFERWATLMIIANPEREYERLQKAVLNMPISNPDDKKERFPKEIPRRLFPDIGDLKIREEIEDQIMKQCGVDLPEITVEERDEATRSRRSPVSATSSIDRTHSYERGRPPPAKSSPPTAKPRVRTASTSPVVIDDEDETIPSAPIERERKPYRATPGGGKVYEGPGSSTGSGTQAPSHSHSGSFSTPRQTDTNIKSHQPPSTRMSMPDAYDRDSLYARTGSGSGSSTTPGRRFSRGSRSSSRSVNQRTGDYRHSESDLLSRDRDHLPRYGGISAQDLQYMESPTSVSPEVDEPRRFHHNRGSSARPDEDYYRGMLGGQGGGPVHTHAHGHGYDKYYR